jgi:alpha-glucosidase
MLQSLQQAALGLCWAASLVSAYTPTISDPNAPNAQTSCPGYQAQDITTDVNKLTATLALAGTACNVYGTDIDTLQLTVEYQDTHRLAVNIEPMYMVRESLFQMRT